MLKLIFLQILSFVCSSMLLSAHPLSEAMESGKEEYPVAECERKGSGSENPQ
jgi:hypothetical protein